MTSRENTATVAVVLAEAEGASVASVDVPAFVAGLIAGVFQAIVNATIEQMQAYAELIADVATTVDQFPRRPRHRRPGRRRARPAWTPVR